MRNGRSKIRQTNKQLRVSRGCNSSLSAGAHRGLVLETISEEVVRDKRGKLITIKYKTYTPAAGRKHDEGKPGPGD